MSTGCFVDKQHQPGAEEIRAALGPALPAWEELVGFMRESYQMEVEPSFGGKNYGWNLWYRKSGKSLVSLFPQQGHLVAQVVLGREQVERALTLELGTYVHRAIEETPQFHDGRWLFIKIIDVEDARDVAKLIQLKRRPQKRENQG
jgi:hypothetical protein